MYNYSFLKQSRKIISNSSLRSLSALITGTALSQFIPAILSPVLTRLYAPVDLGSLALFMSISMVLAVAATARYEQAIILPKDDNDSLNLVVLSISIAVIFVLGLVTVRCFFGEIIATWINYEEANTFLNLLSVSVFLVAIQQSLYYWFNRKKLYKEIAFNKVAFSTVTVVSQIGFHKIAGFGLILGYLLGQVVSVIYSAIQMRSSLIKRDEPIEINITCMLAQARRYIKFPKYLLVGHVMNAVSGNMPVVLFTGLYGTSFSGFYALTFRVVALPMSLIGTAISDVFRQTASNIYVSEGKCSDLFLKIFKSLLVISILPFTIFFFSSQNLFPLIFGAEWSKAGTYAYLLTPMLFCQFITIPLCSMFIIAEKQEWDLAWQIARMILSIASIWIGYALFKNDEISVLLYALAFCMLYLASGVMSYSFSLGSNQVKP
jgi:O-antigen/teichoic acid export membrane protein